MQYICGLIAAGESLLDRACDALGRELAPLQQASETWPFDLTDYYAPQMGTGLLRRFVTLGGLSGPEMLAEWKVRTNAIEQRFAAEPSADAARPVNLDPGYVASPKLVLASMKDFAHRVYLGRGVYAEVTLMYRKGWQPLPWTFPDFASGRYDEFLTAVRDDLRRELTRKEPAE
ncbi:MAG: DUF4416 family protein [Phycisphaerae bacterium]